MHSSKIRTRIEVASSALEDSESTLKYFAKIIFEEKAKTICMPAVFLSILNSVFKCISDLSVEQFYIFCMVWNVHVEAT